MKAGLTSRKCAFSPYVHVHVHEKRQCGIWSIGFPLRHENILVRNVLFFASIVLTINMLSFSPKSLIAL